MTLVLSSLDSLVFMSSEMTRYYKLLSLLTLKMTTLRRQDKAGLRATLTWAEAAAKGIAVFPACPVLKLLPRCHHV